MRADLVPELTPQTHETAAAEDIEGQVPTSARAVRSAVGAVGRPVCRRSGAPIIGGRSESVALHGCGLAGGGAYALLAYVESLTGLEERDPALLRARARVTHTTPDLPRRGSKPTPNRYQVDAGWAAGRTSIGSAEPKLHRHCIDPTEVGRGGPFFFRRSHACG